MAGTGIEATANRSLAEFVWQQKYRADDEGTVDDTWVRVAAAVAGAEAPDRCDIWHERFLALLRDHRFLPGGRILANAGAGYGRTLFNCFVMDRIEDSMTGIFHSLAESAITMQQGGGIGVDFSTLRPAGMPARRSGGTASGPVSFMKIWETMCATLLETNIRRGAMMATLRCDHPDIERFVAAKLEAGALVHFNLSVLVTDAFMAAVRDGADWPLVFPDPKHRLNAAHYLERRWPGFARPVACAVVREIPARALWESILKAGYAASEPGVLFIDRINAENNLGYCEEICATNPCGEIPLPPNGACNLGSINLARFVREAFTRDAHLDMDAIARLVPDAVRFLDNVIDISPYPLEAQAVAARRSRRIGLGITGLADALIMLGLRYDSASGRQCAARTMRLICDSAYAASIELAREKGPFPAYDLAYLERPFIRRLPDRLQQDLGRYGIRNSHLLAVAPAGSISLLADNVSSGIEPLYALASRRQVRDAEGCVQTFGVAAYAVAQWRAKRGIGGSTTVPPACVTVDQLSPEAHVDMQAALQPLVDNAISKTVNVPATLAYDSFRRVFDYAYAQGLKGCTTYRPSPVREAVLAHDDSVGACCDLSCKTPVDPERITPALHHRGELPDD